MPFDIWVPPKPAIIVPASKELIATHRDPRLYAGLTMLARTSMLRSRRSTAGPVGPITFVNSAQANATGDVTVTLPAMLEFDVVVLFASVRATTPTLTGPGGTWTAIGAQVTQSNVILGAFYKVMGASPDSSVTVTVGGSIVTAIGIAQVFRGVDIVTPIDVARTSATSGSGSPNPAAIVPTTDNCAIVVGAASINVDATPGTIANYSTPVTEAVTASNNSTMSSAYRILVGGAGGSEDPAAWSSWSTTQWASLTVALRSAL